MAGSQLVISTSKLLTIFLQLHQKKREEKVRGLSISKHRSPRGSNEELNFYYPKKVMKLDYLSFGNSVCSFFTAVIALLIASFSDALALASNSPNTSRCFAVAFSRRSTI